MINPPSPNGRTTGGRFAPGNPGGPGNPFARKSAAIRTLIMETVTDDDIRDIVKTLVLKAKAGEPAAIRELLNRMIGRTPDAVDPDRLSHGEAELQAAQLVINERIRLYTRQGRR